MDISKCDFILHGKSDFIIILPENASVAQKFASDQLQTFLERATSCRLTQQMKNDPLPSKCILLGDHPAIKKLIPKFDLLSLGEEGYLVHITPNRIIIAGSKSRGTIYGIVSFLEKYAGIQFFDPEFIHVPTLSKLQLPCESYKETPSFDFRLVTYLNLLDPDFSVYLRANMNPFAEEHQGAQAKKLSTAHMSHTFSQLVDPKKYFKDHPEYFALVNGYRVGGTYSQLCCTNPDVIKIAFETVLRWFKEDPGILSMGVVQNDVDGWCECEKCRKFESQHGGAHSAPIINMCNKIGDLLAEVLPDKFIHTIAYTYSLEPPQNLPVRNNVMVIICDMYPACMDNKPIGQHPLTRRYLDIVREWRQLTPNVMIWHYSVDFVHFLLPFPNFKALYENVRIYHDLKIPGVLFQATTSPTVYGEFEEFRNWFLYKILWNSDLSYEYLVDSFISGYYGKAALLIRQYFDNLYVLTDDPSTKLHLYSGLESIPALSKSFILEWQEKMNQALVLVQDNPIFTTHVEKVLLSLDYTYLIFPVEYQMALGKIFPKDFEYRTLVLNRFKSALKKFNIGSINEHLSIDEFLSRQDVICHNNSILAIAELAPIVLGSLQSLLDLVKSAADEKNNIHINNFIIPALKRGFHPLYLNHWLLEKNLAEWTTDGDIHAIWTRKLNFSNLKANLNPHQLKVKKQDLPAAIDMMLDGLPHQMEKFEDE